jgi:hypothetical protein
LSAANSSDGSFRSATGAVPLRKSTSTLLTSPPLCDQVCGGVRRQLQELETILQPAAPR